MNFLKKILLTLIIIIFSFILFSLLQKRQTIINKIQLKEGLTNVKSPDYNSILSNVESVVMDPVTFPSGISSNINSTTNSLPLKQLCIKGSCNSAYSGKYISELMVNYVLSRGCRFLDFEIYYLPDSSGNYTTCVGYSNDPNAINPTISNSENVPFIDIFESTINKAFIKSSSSIYEIININDPLFINIRLKTSKEDIPTLFQSIQRTINSVSKKPMYSRYFTETKINGNTILSSINGKVIIIFEKNEFIDISSKNNKYNMISNSEDLTKSTYEKIDPNKFIACPPKILSDSKVVFNCDHTFNMVVPENYKSSQSNPEIFTSIKEYGNNITLFQYYNSDNYLLENEYMFQKSNSAFIPLSYCLTYINNREKPSKSVFPNLIGS